MVKVFSQSFSYEYVCPFLLGALCLEFAADFAPLGPLFLAFCSHNWSLVNLGLWRKYPNPYSAHVLSVE